MINGLSAGFFLAAALVPIVVGTRLYLRRPSSSTLSYLLYLTLWNFQVIFTTAFLLYARYLPKTGQLGFILFNAIFLIPIHAATAVLYADFLWKRLGRRLSWYAKTLLAAPFLVVLATYARQTILRLAHDPAPSSFQVRAPLSIRIMVLAVVGFSVAGILISGKKRDAMPIAGLTAAGMIIGFLLMGGNYTSFLSYILYGIIGLATNVPAFIVLGIRSRRGYYGSAYRGVPVSRLKETGERFSLSAREREILALVYRGQLNREIARDLHISLDTVKKHVYNIFKKTGVRNRLQLFQLVIGDEFPILPEQAKRTSTR
jgi:DNA-binding CsgD family transcriptional regulator